MGLPSASVSRAGFGRVGYCSLCSFQDVAKLNKHLASGWNARQVNDWLFANYNFRVSRPTIYKHKDEHAAHPADRVVTAVERAQTKGVMMPRQASKEQFLEAVRDLAYQRAVDHPDEVTIEHGLKAESILASRKSGGRDAILILARVMSGGDAGVIIEGEAREISS